MELSDLRLGNHLPSDGVLVQVLGLSRSRHVVVVGDAARVSRKVEGSGRGRSGSS